MCQDRLSSTLDMLVMHYWFIAKILKFVSNLCIKHSWWTVILTMAFPGTSILIGFPELMQKWWQLSQCWVSSHFILPKLWQPWVTFTNGLLFMVGITMFQSNLFPCRHFFFKVLSKSAAVAGMFYTCDNVIYLMCPGKMIWEASQ